MPEAGVAPIVTAVATPGQAEKSFRIQEEAFLQCRLAMGLA